MCLCISLTSHLISLYFQIISEGQGWECPREPYEVEARYIYTYILFLVQRLIQQCVCLHLQAGFFLIYFDPFLFLLCFQSNHKNTRQLNDLI